MFESVECFLEDRPVGLPALTRAELNASDLDPAWEDCFPTPADELLDVLAAQPFFDGYLAAVRSIPMTELSEAGRARLLVALHGYTSYVESVKSQLIAAIAGSTPTGPHGLEDDFAPCEVAMATRTSVYAAARRVAVDRDLAERFPATLAALAADRITHQQAGALCDATRHLDLGIARKVETRMLRYAWRQDRTAFTNSLRRAIAALDPDWTARADDNRREAIVEHTAHPDGTGQLYLRGPLETTTAISLALDAYATTTKDTLGGTANQRKLAGLRDLAESYLTTPGQPRHHGLAAAVVATLDLASLLNLRAGIAEIVGVGQIPVSVAQHMLADGAPLRLLITDPDTGKALRYSTTAYQVPPALAELLIATNPTSASPNSTINSTGADMEHNIPHHAGGPTNPINVTPIDRRWHRAKTHGGYRYQKDPDTSIITWTSPTGLTCQIDPYDYRTGP